MRKICYLLLLTLLVQIQACSEPVTICPVKKITTCDKYFHAGNSYEFRNTKTGEKIIGTVLFYRPNGVMGQEAQIEIGDFKTENNEPLTGIISIVPANHKVFQEFMNYYSASWCTFVRGSEVILTPNQEFVINNAPKKKPVTVIKIKPHNRITTAHDSLESGDIVEFTVTNDVYKNNKLYIKAYSPIYGILDYVEDNGWIGDNAKIGFKKFVTYDVNGVKTILNSDLNISGLDILKYKHNKTAQFFNYIGVIFRGKEVDITEKDTNISFNLMIE